MRVPENTAGRLGIFVPETSVCGRLWPSFVSCFPRARSSVAEAPILASGGRTARRDGNRPAACAGIGLVTRMGPGMAEALFPEKAETFSLW